MLQEYYMFCKQLMYCVMTKRSHITIQYNMMHYCFLPSYCTVTGHSVTFSSSLFISFTSINKGELLSSLGIGSGNWQTYVTYFHVVILSQRDTLTHCSFKPHPCFFPATILMIISCTAALGLCILALKSF